MDAAALMLDRIRLSPSKKTMKGFTGIPRETMRGEEERGSGAAPGRDGWPRLRLARPSANPGTFFGPWGPVAAGPVGSPEVRHENDHARIVGGAVCSPDAGGGVPLPDARRAPEGPADRPSRGSYRSVRPDG